MGSGEVAIVALSTMISLKVTFSDGLGGYNDYSNIPFPVFQAINVVARRSRNVSPRNFGRMACTQRPWI